MLQYGRERPSTEGTKCVLWPWVMARHSIRPTSIFSCCFPMITRPHGSTILQFCSLKTKLQAHKPPGGMLQPEYTLKLDSGNIEPFHSFTRGTCIFCLFVCFLGFLFVFLDFATRCLQNSESFSSLNLVSTWMLGFALLFSPTGNHYCEMVFAWEEKYGKVHLFLDQLTADVFRGCKSNFTKLSSTQAIGNSPQFMTWCTGRIHHLLPSGLVETTDLGFCYIVPMWTQMRKPIATIPVI